MRVLHIQKAKGIGGCERHLLDLLPGLRELGLEVRFLVLAAPGVERFLAALEARHVPVRVLPAGADADPREARKIRHEIRAAKPDLVHTHLLHADIHGQLAARWARIPAISSIHSVHAFYRHEPYRSAARLAGRLAARTIAISHYCARYVLDQALVPPMRLRVVPYGICSRDWVPATGGRVSARGALGLGHNDFVVGMASRIVPGKGHVDALAAVGSVLKRVPNVRLAIAGDGDLRSALEARASQTLAGRVSFLGFMEDVRPALWASDVLLFLTRPDLGEGFGLAALEGMASGSPVIATRVASLPEIVGEGGILVDPGSPESVAGAIETLAQDEHARIGLGATAAKRAKQFDIERTLSETVNVYKEVLT